MFVRFRETLSTVQASLVAGRRVDGRVRHEQIASLGTIKLPLTIDGRETFWRELHEILARLGNRIPPETHGKILGQVHGRIPMVTGAERREHEIELAEREQQIWQGFCEMLAERAEGEDGLAAKATASAAADHASAKDAQAKAAAAASRLERLRKGEDVPRGQAIDVERILREAGLTNADIEHCRVVAQLPPEAMPVLIDVAMAASKRAERAVARRLLRAADEE